MPEMRFRLRWPDGVEDDCYSPSLIIKDYFRPGGTYPMAAFLSASREALLIASDRVKARYGMPCSLALGQLRQIEARGQAFAADAAATVTVVLFRE